MSGTNMKTVKFGSESHEFPEDANEQYVKQFFVMSGFPQAANTKLVECEGQRTFELVLEVKAKA